MREVADALVTRFDVRREEDARERFATGAVYENGALVRESQRHGGAAGDIVLSDDPETTDVVATTDLDGTWLYGGHLMGQFGHFICETVTNLWPVDREVRGVLFHPFIFGRDFSPWMRELITMAGWPADVEIRVVDQPTRVERLLVPTRPFTINQGTAHEAVSVWQRMAPHRREVTPPVFFSRSRLESDPRRSPGDELLDAEFSSRGFKVLHPQSLSVRQQIDVVRSASHVVATAGSALHLSAFAGADTRVIEIGDSRSHSTPLLNQTVIDAARGHTVAFVPYRTQDGNRDIAATMASVDLLLKESRRRRWPFLRSRRD